MHSMGRKPVIAVIGSGAETEPAVSHARELGMLVAGRGWTLMTGGRNAGVMRAASEGARTAGGLTIGILPDADTEVSPAVEVAIITGTGEARNNVIVLSADVVIGCGAEDAGTASEIALALKAGRPVVLLGASHEALAFFKLIGGDRVTIAVDAGNAIDTVAELLAGQICTGG